MVGDIIGCGRDASGTDRNREVDMCAVLGIAWSQVSCLFIVSYDLSQQVAFRLMTVERTGMHMA